jgi:rhodanese-related sulfurtransferase
MDHHDEEFLRKAAVAKDRVEQIEPRLIDAQISSGVAVIDVRESDEHAKATVPGAKNIAIGSLAEKIASVVPDKSAPVICFCNGGNRGAMAAAELLDLGYTNVKSIAGGLRAYQAQKESK